MNNKTYIEKAKDREILNHILEYIASSTNSIREDEFAEAVELSSDGQIPKEEFHDWMGTFDLRDYID